MANVNDYSQKFITVEDTRFKQGIYANKIKKMPLPPPKERTAHGTYLYFAETGMLETFMRDYRRILMDNFQKVRIEGTGEYWTCGQTRDPRNWNWKPWQHLEWLCLKRGMDDFAVRDILLEHQGRKLECECQFLYDERELRMYVFRPLGKNLAFC